MKIEITTTHQVKRLIKDSLREVNTRIARMEDRIMKLEKQNKELRFIK